MSKEYYIIKTSYCSYYIEIWHQYPTIDKVYIGGKRKCITFSIYLDEPDPNLDALGYNENCNISENRHRQHGTHHMILTSFAFIKKMYAGKGVSQKFILRDSSYINCQSYIMSLAYYYIMHHNSTWYEKKFKAEPVFELERNEYHMSMQTWKRIKKTKPDMSSFFNLIKNISRKKFLDIFTSLAEFLEKTKKGDCFIYKDWGEPFLNTYFKNINGMSWVIDASLLDINDKIKITAIGTSKPKDMFIHTGGTLTNGFDIKYI